MYCCCFLFLSHLFPILTSLDAVTRKEYTRLTISCLQSSTNYKLQKFRAARGATQETTKTTNYKKNEFPNFRARRPFFLRRRSSRPRSGPEPRPESGPESARITQISAQRNADPTQNSDFLLFVVFVVSCVAPRAARNF